MMIVWGERTPKTLAASLKPIPAHTAFSIASHVSALITWRTRGFFLGFLTPGGGDWD
jgi:hypothetical protein